MEENVAIVYCTEEDFNFLASDFEHFATQLLSEFDLPMDSDVLLEIDGKATAGEIDVIYNGEILGKILIEDQEPKEEDDSEFFETKKDKKDYLH